MRYECYFCHIKTIEKLIKKFKPDARIAENFIFSVHKLLADNRKMPNTRLATKIHRIAKKHLRNTNLYAEEKLMANEMLLKKYSYWKSLVSKSDNPFFTAVKLSVIGNIIDYGAHSLSGDILAQIESFFQKDLKIDMIKNLENEIFKAKKILFLGDNCGEIVFDKLLIETMNHPNITFAVRGKPIINDVTIEDAKQIEMDKVCSVISSGADAPSTLLDLSSGDFIKEFNDADLIISKGQGNFEGLMEESGHPNIFFLLIAKCDPIAELLGVNKNDMVVKK